MYKIFLGLEIKKLFRSASLKTDIGMKIFKGIAILYIILIFTSFGIGLHYKMFKSNLSALEQVNKFIVYYFAFEFFTRFLLQKMPTANIKPLLIQNISRKKIVSYFVGKSTFGSFNILQLFFLIPFTCILIIEKKATLNSLSWALAMYSFVYCLHFINILLNNNKAFFISVFATIAIIGGLHYFNLVDLTVYAEQFFGAFYKYPLCSLIPFLLALTLAFYTNRFYLQNLYLDNLFSNKREVAKANDLKWLEQFGKHATFLKNDIRLIMRNKRARSTVLMSFLFLFYGFLVLSNYNDIKYMDTENAIILAGIFVTGGFLLTFGQYVPSWESAHYPLMMTRKVTYHNYLESKWSLIVFGTLLSIMLAVIYLFIYDWKVYAVIVACGIFNIGINSYLVLLGGAYLKSPIDLSSNKNIFGDTKSFNLKVMLISLPKLILPFFFFYIGKMIYGFEGGIALLVISGILGLVFKKPMFKIIEKIYKREKYDTLQAYKQK